MRTVYIADDNTMFDDEDACRDYEFKLNHPHLKELILYDQDNNELDDLFSEDVYGKTGKVTVLSDAAARDLLEFCTYTGFSAYETIKSAGEWIYSEEQYCFVKVDE